MKLTRKLKKEFRKKLCAVLLLLVFVTHIATPAVATINVSTFDELYSYWTRTSTKNPEAKITANITSTKDLFKASSLTYGATATLVANNGTTWNGNNYYGVRLLKSPSIYSSNGVNLTLGEADSSFTMNNFSSTGDGAAVYVKDADYTSNNSQVDITNLRSRITNRPINTVVLFILVLISTLGLVIHFFSITVSKRRLHQDMAELLPL